MTDLLLTSYNAQCKYIERRIENEKDLFEFKFVREQILINGPDSNLISYGKYGDLARNVYIETKNNLISRFETGTPLDTWSYCP